MDIIVSIVSGTYNRLGYLKHMVESVRNSIGVGIPYEIVLVDGGSTDGTLQWCSKQHDIVVIEHGELKGAVKAFNDGAFSARGEYVILANDDIFFIDESILAAIAYMQDHPDCGIGCFYQDRYGKAWHIEEMSALQNGISVTVPYGQVCIVPKWLGDRLGWWGDYLHTYGGDNELSCNVLEYGYKIEPIDGASIHDSTALDVLRIINSDYDKTTLHMHPDSAKWVKKWTRNGKFGANIRNSPSEPNTISKLLRILYAPIYEIEYPHQKIQKHGLRDALARKGMIVEVDWRLQSFDKVLDVAMHFKPHLIVLQLQDSSLVTVSKLALLRQENPDAIIVNWNGDYHIENLTDPGYISMMKIVNLAGFVTTSLDSLWALQSVNSFYWQIGYEEVAEPLPAMPAYDILFLGNGYSEERLKLGTLLRSLGKSVGIYGMWPPKLRPNGYNVYDFRSGAALYKKCKIAIGDSQWPHATGFVSNRLFQAMSAGAFLLQQEFDGLDTLLGLVDGVHLATYHDLSDLPVKIKYYLEHPELRIKIAKQGQEEILKHHSFDVRVAELFDRIKNV